MASYMSLAGKVILVTGASSGLGKASAARIAGLGAHLVLSGRDERRLSDSREALGDKDHRIVAGDLNDHSVIAALVDACPPLDGIVYSAGVARAMPLKLIDDAHMREMFDINFRSAVVLLQHVLSKRRLNKFASVVLISSISAHTGTRGMSIYSASKGALEGFIRPAAVELLPREVRVNCVAPAVVRTEIFTSEQHEWLAEQERNYPLGIGRPEDVANAIAFLLSDNARSITGSALVIDGGCTNIM